MKDFYNGPGDYEVCFSYRICKIIKVKAKDRRDAVRKAEKKFGRTETDMNVTLRKVVKE